MKLSIRGVSAAKEEEWDHIWGRCDYSTYFHSREWAEIWQQYRSGVVTSEARLIHFTDGMLALIPCSYEKILNGFIKRYLMSPAGTFGGWLSLDQLTESHAELLHEYINRSFRNLSLRANPYNLLASNLEGCSGEAERTQSIDLGSGFEGVYKKWSKGHKAAVSQARKAGVLVRAAETRQDWADYFQIYENTLERWGDSATSRYTWELFQAIYETSSSNVKLWVAMYDDRMIAGALCFYAKSHVVYWHGASLESHRNVRPVNLLMFEAVQQCCADGYQWFDFNPSGKLEGVRAFKKSFGTQDLPCPMTTARSKALNALQRFVALKKKVAS